MNKPRDPRQGWRIHAARTVHETPWMRVREYRATAPTGAPATYTILAPKHVAIGMLPLFEDGSVPMVGQSRFTMGAYSWEVPEGGGKLNAPPLTSAQRELAEETALEAAHWQEILNSDLSNSLTDERAVAYVCWGLSAARDRAQADDVEDITTWRLPLGEVLAMADKGEITDAFTLLIVYKAVHMARTGALPAEAAALMAKGGVTGVQG